MKTLETLPADTLPAPISPVAEIAAELGAGRMVILVDEEDRENEGDLVLAADHVSPEAINFMATHGRGLICLTLTRERCQQLGLRPMTNHNTAPLGTAFTVTIEAAHGVTTGISAADRAHTIAVAVAPDATAADLVQPGHVFPLQAVDGGVLMRAGHTEASCDFAHLAGCSPAAVICEIMKDDGSMARLPDLQLFAARHGLKIGTIASLIEYRSRHETLVEEVAARQLQTCWGAFETRVYRDKTNGALHLALSLGNWNEAESIPVRVHEPLSIMDLLDSGQRQHSWSVAEALAYIRKAGKGVAVLLNCGEDGEQLLAQFRGVARASHGPQRGRMALRNHGIGSQILRQLGIRRMRLLGTPRHIPSLTGGFGLEVTEYIRKDQEHADH